MSPAPSFPSSNLAEHHDGQPLTAIDAVDGNVSTEISRWFEQHGVAWSGTPGELARAIRRPVEQVLHAIQHSRTALLVFGIAATVSRESCRTVVCLRSLDDNLPQEETSATCDSGVEAWEGGTPAEHESPSDVLSTRSAEYSGNEHSANKTTTTSSAVWNIDEWRNKLILASLNPVEEPPHDRGRLLLLTIGILVGVLALSIAGHFVYSNRNIIPSRSSPTTSFIAEPASAGALERDVHSNLQSRLA
jgi:hypothetical protein